VKDRGAPVAPVDDMVDIPSALLAPGHTRHDVYKTPPRGERSKK
jgi:hypothetical protein